MPKLTHNDAVLNFETWGEHGPWLTLLNGYTRPYNDFRMMARHLQEHGLRVLALDNRGAGLTISRQGFSMHDMLQDVVALWNELKITKTALLGISMGGFLAQQLALDHRHTVTKLVLVSTAPDQEYLTRETLAWTTNENEVMEKMLPYFTPEFFARNQTLVKAMVKQITRAVETGDFAVRAAQQKSAISGFGTQDRLAEITVPTLVIHGSDDRIIDPRAARALASGIKGAKLEIFEATGHLLLAEAPRRLYQCVLDFIQD